MTRFSQNYPLLAGVLSWLGDRLPDPVGSWLLRVADDSVEPWTDAEGRLMRRD